MATTNINIDPTNFGRSTDKFFLSSPDMYLDFHDGSGLVRVGYLEAEKTFRAILEWAVFETDIPLTEVARDVVKQTFELEGSLKQFQRETLAWAMNRRNDESDATYDRVIMGTTLPPLETPSCVLIGATKDAEEMRLYIRKLQIATETIEIMMGASEYSSIPFKASALQDSAPLTTNPTWAYNPLYPTQDNVAFFAFPKAS